VLSAALQVSIEFRWLYQYSIESHLQIDKYKAKGALKEIGIAKVSLEEFFQFY